MTAAGWLDIWCGTPLLDHSRVRGTPVIHFDAVVVIVLCYSIVLQVLQRVKSETLLTMALTNLANVRLL